MDEKHPFHLNDKDHNNTYVNAIEHTLYMNHMHGNDYSRLYAHGTNIPTDVSEIACNSIPWVLQ